MPIRQLRISSIIRCALAAVICSLAVSHNALAVETPELSSFKWVKVLKVDHNLKLNGLKVGDGIYMGHAKVAGDYGLGVVIDRKTYAWGINDHGIAFLKRF